MVFDLLTGVDNMYSNVENWWKSLSLFRVMDLLSDVLCKYTRKVSVRSAWYTLVVVYLMLVHTVTLMMTRPKFKRLCFYYVCMDTKDNWGCRHRLCCRASAIKMMYNTANQLWYLSTLCATLKGNLGYKILAQIISVRARVEIQEMSKLDIMTTLKNPVHYSAASNSDTIIN